MSQSPLEYVLAHWSKLIENFSTSSDDFYDAVEASLERRQLPEVGFRSVEWSEGGVLSPNREYLRIEGSGLAFDICAAPFGTGFFFSWWLTKKRPAWPSLYLIAFAVATFFIYRGLLWVIPNAFRGVPPFSTPWAIQVLLLNPFSLFALSLLVLFWAIATAARGGMRGAEEVMLTVPVLGWVYERWFAPVTFYRLDTASMFRATTNAAVLEVIDDLTTKKGLRALAPEDRKPLFDRLG